MTTRIKLRRDTYQNWYDHNPTLALGEPGYDTTNNQVKVGDGTTAWRALDPLTAALGDLVVAGSTITSPEGVHQDLVLSTVDTGPTTHDWTFGLDGTTTFPSGAGFVLGDEGQLKVNDGTTSSLDLRDASGRGFYTGSDGFTIRGNSGKTWEFNQDGKLRLPGSTNSAFIHDVDDRMVISNYGTDWWNTLGINSAEGTFTFTINDTGLGDPIYWEFNNNGGTTLPGKLHGAVDLDPIDDLPVGHTLSIAPASDHSSKSFNFRIDQYSGPYSFTRAYLDMPVAEFRKQVAITFAHDNETGGYIHMQGSDFTGDGLDNAFNIQSSGADIKLSATGQIWKFGTDGALTLPNGSSIESTSGNGIGLTTDRGTILFGNSPEPGGPTHFHIMKTSEENGSGGLDLFFGDDYNYVLQRPASYNGSAAYGVEIGTNDRIGGDQQTWRFGTDGSLTLPQYDTAISQYDGETTFDGGSDDIGVQVNVDKTIYLRVGDNNWVFGAGAGGANILQLPAGGEIKSAAGTGDVVIEANDGTARTWTFGSTGDLVLPGNTSSIKNTNGTLYKVAPNYGSFYDTTTQTNTSVGDAIPISYNTTDINNGITITGTGNTEIRIATAGTYNIQFSLQVRKTDSGADTVYIWLDKNGSNVDNSGTALFLTGSNAAEVAAWNFVINAAANDYYRLMWMSTDSHVEIVAVPAGAVVPAIPSVILTVVPVGA